MPSSALPTYLREGRQYGLVGDPQAGRFHILDVDSFPTKYECGLGPIIEANLIDFYPDGEVCENCITVVALEARAQELLHLQATVHENVDCAKCRAPTGERCRSMPAGWSRRLGESGRILKHSHVERLHAAGIPLR